MFGPSGGDGGSGLVQIAPLILIFVVFYFFLIRPQQTKAKQHRQMLDALRRGDRVVTAGGVIGTVSKVEAEEVLVDIAEGVRVRIVRSTIANVLAKPEPVAAKKPKDEGEGDRKPEPAASAPAPGDGKGGLVNGLKRLMGGG